MTSAPPLRSPARTRAPGLLAVLLCGTLLAACSADRKPAAPAAAGPLPVTVLEVTARTVPTSIEVMAQTEGARETEVRARVGGIVTQRLYREGEPVKAGQALFQIDRTPYEIALAAARARAEQTAREARRLKELVAGGAIAGKDADDAASADALAQAELRQAELNLAWTTVTAPVAGITGRAVKSEGNLVAASDNLLTSIHQTQPIWVRFALGESDLARFPNRRVTARDIAGIELVLPDGSVYARRGKLNFLASSIDTTLGTQQLRAEFDNPDLALLPGQFVRARLLTGERSGVFLVPQAAVTQTDQGALVMTVGAENKVTPRPVRTGEWRGKDWVILEGLKAGDKVIVDNLIKLRPGMPVSPKGPGEPPANAAPAPAKP
ncbi:MAG: efflux RND transporter periplasmic adaptor subunit [Proteobacteria bacterium]|nr:efflux RND transporter periplasmic adaptor subunit [Pseudomonadota bacterium]